VAGNDTGNVNMIPGVDRGLWRGIMVAMLQRWGLRFMTLGDDVITVKDASEQTGYSAEYLRRLIRQGKIEASKLGTVYLVDIASLMAYVREQQADGSGNTGPRSKAVTAVG
jgi:excisionase family DNA binding protein